MGGWRSCRLGRLLPRLLEGGHALLHHAAPSLAAQGISHLRRSDPCREWYELPAPQMTKEIEHDLRLLGLRGILASDRFYKRPDSKKLPTYFQMGTVIEAPEEFYSGSTSITALWQAAVTALPSTGSSMISWRSARAKLQPKPEFMPCRTTDKA